MARPLRHGYSFEHDDRGEPINSRPRGYQQYSPQSPQHYNDTSHVPGPVQFSQAPQYDRFHPSVHTDTAYNRLRNPRYADVDHSPVFERQSPVPRPGYPSPPMILPDEHRRSPAPQGLAYSQSMRTNSTVTPGMDNLGSAAAGGGITGIAVGVAHTNERESGVAAMRGIHDEGAFRGPPERAAHPLGSDTPYIPSMPEPVEMGTTRSLRGHDSFSSNIALRTAMDVPGQLTPGRGSPHFTPSERSLPMGYYNSQYTGAGGLYDDPYHRHSATWSYGVNPEPINPDDIIDDGDDGFLPNPQRRSVLSLGRNSSHNSIPTASTGAATGGVTGSTSGLANAAQTHNDPNGGPSYDAVPVEKSEWLNRQNTGNKRMKWIVGIVIALILAGAVAGGIVGGVLGSHKSNPSSSGGGGTSGKSAGDDIKSNGDLDKNSPEIKALMNNPNLHKVFPGIDYTPWGTQYPLCLKYPPSQNNVTRDITVLSQLTNTVRLYGTDCNQTEMVLHAINKLGLKNMKIWLGVWLDTNTTTNERQLDQLYKIVNATPDKSVFKGAIVGNEVLFRGSATPWATENTLINYLKSVKSNLTAMNAAMPVATSDLGDKWTAQLATAADAVMANVHPFFGGIPVEDAASWTWTFWQTHNVILTYGTKKPQIISEVGWPSGGGSDCSPFETCPNAKAGAIAGVNEMNQFMNDWVCQSLENGTDYFWFEAFDEPWKIQYNTPGKEWEDKWGLLDPDRKLKPGLKIPDCGGKVAS